MGLGKTVQIISFISLLFKSEGCLPFLIVVSLVHFGSIPGGLLDSQLITAHS